METGCTPAPQRIQVAGAGIELRRTGQGKSLVFLHPGDGLDDSSALLGRLARHYDVVAPSHPGIGGSDLPRAFRTVDDLAYFYLDFLEAQNLKDVILFGVSFGAWIAAEVAIKSTARLS